MADHAKRTVDNHQQTRDARVPSVDIEDDFEQPVVGWTRKTDDGE
jgi:hypothetical protein